jgi:hypothetical protein
MFTDNLDNELKLDVGDPVRLRIVLGTCVGIYGMKGRIGNVVEIDNEFDVVVVAVDREEAGVQQGLFVIPACHLVKDD